MHFYKERTVETRSACILRTRDTAVERSPCD